MPDLTPEAQQSLVATAQRHGVSLQAALAVLHALQAGGGGMAQFNHPELGGVGQWSQGGMTMVGDMFNQGLKHRVDALCSELSSQVQRGGAARATGSAQSQFQAQGGAGRPSAGFGFTADSWWPAELGTPASSGAQNDLRYAYFPAACRLAIQQNGRLRLFDTGDHRIFGVSQQQQGGGAQIPTFTSDKGDVRLADLKPVDAGAQGPAAPPHARPIDPPAGDPIATIERLAALHEKGILTPEEFAAKKAELLARL